MRRSVCTILLARGGVKDFKDAVELFANVRGRGPSVPRGGSLAVTWHARKT